LHVTFETNKAIDMKQKIVRTIVVQSNYIIVRFYLCFAFLAIASQTFTFIVVVVVVYKETIVLNQLVLFKLEIIIAAIERSVY
jgi:uncharacterized SAM-binding protein YcdF (DUF218 family)